MGKQNARGRTETGRLFEQTLRATNGAGEAPLREARDGGPGPADAGRRGRDPSADQLCRPAPPAPRWSPSCTAGAGRSRPRYSRDGDRLNGEINALGYPKAALFSFCMALVAYNVLATVKAALAFGAWSGEGRGSCRGSYLADEVQMCHRGMMRAIPKDEWVVFQAADHN